MVEEGRDSAGDDDESAAHVHTFLIADVRGYTRFTQSHGDEEAGRLAAEFARLAREVVVASGGKVIELRGDEALCVFNSARQAIRGAVELQRAFRRRAEGSSLFPLPIGIGLDAGEAVPIEGGYRGAALNTAARLCSMAQPGQILATETTVTLAQKIDGIRFRERRAVRLKGLEKPVRLIEVESIEPLPPLPVVAAPPRPRGRRTWMAAGIAAVVIVAAALFAVFRSGGGDSQQRLAASAIGTIDSHGVRSQTRLGSAPSALAPAKDAVWIASASAGTVSRFDRATRALETLPIGGAPAGVAVGAGWLWVTDGTARRLLQIDPNTQAPIQKIRVGNGPASVAVGKDAVWVANTIDGTVSRFDLARGKVTNTIPVGPSPSAVAVGESGVWVADDETGNVIRIDPRSRTITGSVNVGNGPRAIAVGAGAVWAANSRDGTVVRINPASVSLSGLVTVGADPSAITVGDDGVWVGSSGSGSISRIDPRTVRVTKKLEVGSRPVALVNADGTIYAATVTPLTGHRGGVLRVEGEPSACRCLDPTQYLGTPTAMMVGNVVYDGLVAYRHAAGRAGSTLVPDLALRLPTPTEDGTTYTLQLRPGLRYSDGSPVRASDFRASIERDLAANPYSDLSGIAGAGACRPKHRCDLSKGIEVADKSRTITIHLAHPDPEFLYRLTLPESSIVPARTPVQPRPDQPILGTGPYRLASSARGPTMRLVRNPYFHIWSADARPDGYVDELRIHATKRVKASIRAVERGRADLVQLAFRGQSAEQQRGLFTRVAGRLHLDTQPFTNWWFFNTRVAPFDDVRVRRAVNFAVDRARLNELAGGLDSTTCQVLPSDLPGYRPYCPYTVNPNEAGTWTAPDVPKARSLVAASGTRGTSVAVTTVALPIPLASGRYFVSLLRQLGYKASLRVVDRVRFPPFVADPRNRVQFGLSGWYADKLIPSNFLNPILTCASFKPKSPSNGNLSEYCNPELDAKIKEAALLQNSEPTRANALWSEIDRTLVDQAVTLPWSAPRTRILVSARVGNYQTHALWGPLLDQIWVK